MVRSALTLGLFLALAAWAGAQGPTPPLSAADQIKLLRANRLLLNELIDGGVKLGGADNALDRAAACQKTTHALAVAVDRAADTQDADRVAELGDHFEAVVRDGLVPTLDEAIRTTPPESPRAAELKQLRLDAATDLKSVQDSAGKLGDSGKVKDVRGKLDKLELKK